MLTVEHEIVARDLHRYTFPSSSRPGDVNVMHVDTSEPAGDPARLVCTCDAGLHLQLCWHKSWWINGHRIEDLERFAFRARKARRGTNSLQEPPSIKPVSDRFAAGDGGEAGTPTLPRALEAPNANDAGWAA